MTPAMVSSPAAAEPLLLMGVYPDQERQVTFLYRSVKEGSYLNPGHDREIVMLKADVTRGDAPARPLLEQLNPAGSIPLTVIYSPHTPTPIELTGIYSTSDLQEALDQAASKQPALATAQ